MGKAEADVSYRGKDIQTFRKEWPAFAKGLDDAYVTKEGYIASAVTEPARGDFVRQLGDFLWRLGDYSQVNTLVGEEHQGGYLPYLVAERLHTNPIVSIAKRNLIPLPRQVEIRIYNSYAKGGPELLDIVHLNDITPESKVGIVEDMLDTANTGIALVNGIRSVDAEVKFFLCAYARTDRKGIENMKQSTGIDVKYGVLLDPTEDGVRIAGVNLP